MRKITIILGLVIVFFISFIQISYAEMAKEGSGSYRSGKTGTFEILNMEKEYFQMNFKETGIVVEAPENSPLHNASFTTIGSSYGSKGKWKGNVFVIWTCPNGDKIYGTYKGKGVFGGSSTGVITLVGGTGSCAGIEGSLEMTNTPGIKSPKKGTYAGITVGKFNWKIP